MTNDRKALLIKQKLFTTDIEISVGIFDLHLMYITQLPSCFTWAS